MVVLSKRHWLVGALIALVVYTSVTLAVLWRMPTSTQSTYIGEGGIVVSLGSAGGLPGQVQATAIIEEPVEETEAMEMAEVEQVPEPEATSEPEPEVKLETKPEPKLRQKPKVQPKLKPKKKFKLKPQPKPKRPVTVVQEGELESSEKKIVPIQKNRTQEGNADATPGGGNPGERANYMATIQAWLHRHKEYPSRAHRRHQEGTALLYFVLDRQGNVLRHELRESTGYKLLDREVLKMLKRAQSFPPMPASMPQTTLELLVPIQFKLR